jgi:hypothetical protein
MTSYPVSHTPDSMSSMGGPGMASSFNREPWAPGSWSMAALASVHSGRCQDPLRPTGAPPGAHVRPGDDRCAPTERPAAHHRRHQPARLENDPGWGEGPSTDCEPSAWHPAPSGGPQSRGGDHSAWRTKTPLVAAPPKVRISLFPGARVGPAPRRHRGAFRRYGAGDSRHYATDGGRSIAACRSVAQADTRSFSDCAQRFGGQPGPASAVCEMISLRKRIYSKSVDKSFACGHPTPCLSDDIGRSD